MHVVENTFHTHPSFYRYRKIEKSEKNIIEKRRFLRNHYLLHYHDHLNVALVVEWGRLE